MDNEYIDKSATIELPGYEVYNFGTDNTPCDERIATVRYFIRNDSEDISIQMGNTIFQVRYEGVEKMILELRAENDK